MFWSKKKTAAAAAGKAPLTDPASGEALVPLQTPGYYPRFHTMSQKKYWDATTRDLIEKRVEEQTPIRFFSAEEALTMGAVCDRILPQEDRIAATRIEILPGIDKRLHAHRIDGYRYEDMPPDEDAYRLAARAFEEMAQDEYGKAFHELATMEQETLIKSVHDGKPVAAKKLWKQMNVERFWSLLVTDCCAVYYAHPFAWDEVGFGGPAYPRGYMRLEEGEREPWEVDEQRYEWKAPVDTLSDVEEAHGSGKEHQTQHGQAGTH
jgi:hypothetical protein